MAEPLKLAGPSLPAGENRGQQWLSLGQACRILGVNPSTLRRWADAGRIGSYRTPGGHRRFAAGDVQALMATRVKATSHYSLLGQSALARIRRRLHSSKRQGAPWYLGVQEEERTWLRPLGRRLIALVTESIGRRGRRYRLLEEARVIGGDYGRGLAAAGLPLPDAVEAFIFFRRGLEDAATQVAHKSGLSAEEAAEAWEHIAQVADCVLLALAEAYQQAQKSSPAVPTG